MIDRPLKETIRDAKRLRHVIHVLVSYRFGEFVTASGLGKLLGSSPAGEGDKAADPGTPEHLSPEQRVREVLEVLGPTYIKLGQILSTRPDLIPQSYVDELAKLQSECPSVPFEEIRSRLDDEFNGRTDAIFASIDPEPLAAASMAQAHRATLADSQEVVIKVLRPGIEATIAADINILSSIASLTAKHGSTMGFDPPRVVEEFSKQLSKEINFTHEAKVTERLGRQFDDNDRVAFPKVFHEASTRRVLALEAIGGTILSKLNIHDTTPEVRHRIVENGVDAVFTMCLEKGFFHADPHPGNIFAHEDGSITFIDCGMTGEVDDTTSMQLAQLMQGIATRDLDAVINVVIALSGAKPTLAFDREFRGEVSIYVNEISADATSLANLQIGPILQGLFGLLRKWDIECPSDLVFLIKALATIEGVGATIDPTFDFLGHIRPRLERLVKDRYRPEAIKQRVMKAAAGYVDIIEELPADFRALAALFRNQGLAFKLQHEGLDRLSITIDRASRTIAYGLSVAGIIVGSSVLILAERGQSSLGPLTMLGLAGIISTALIVGILNARNYLKMRSMERKSDRG